MNILSELLEASQAVLPLVRIFDQAERVGVRERFIRAIDAAEAVVEAQASARVDAVIDGSWDMGWKITEEEALMALAIIIESPGRKIAQIKAFRTRTNDGRDRNYVLGFNPPPLKRAKEIIEVTQEVLEHGI